MVNAKDDNRIAAALRIERAHPRSAKRAVRLPQCQRHGERYLQHLVARGVAGPGEDPVSYTHLARAAEIFATLIDAGVVVREATADQHEHAATDPEADAATSHPLDGPAEYYLTVDLPEDFALDQPLSPFLLAALELLDPESSTYTLDLISMVEATLEDPKQILRAQERRARDAAMSAMKAEGVDFEERLERLEDVTYPKPLEEMLDVAFAKYCAQVPLSLIHI